jgi:hypothetical protein
MLGGSPIKVAAPCRLLHTAIAIIIFKGLILSFFANDIAMGATIKTVATFSTKAEIKLVNKQMDNTAQAVFLARLTIISARYAGTRLNIKTSATASIPTNIPITFQLTERNASRGEITLKIIINPPPKRAKRALLLGKKIKEMYANIKITKAII